MACHTLGCAQQALKQAVSKESAYNTLHKAALNCTTVATYRMVRSEMRLQILLRTDIDRVLHTGQKAILQLLHTVESTAKIIWGRARCILAIGLNTWCFHLSSPDPRHRDCSRLWSKKLLQQRKVISCQSSLTFRVPS